MNRSLQPPPPAYPEQGHDALELGKYLWFLADNRWLIARLALAGAVLGAAYAVIATPIYESNIVIHVEEKTEPARNFLGELSSAFNVKTAASTETELIRSRRVVSYVVDSEHLHIEATPRRVPVIGALIARFTPGTPEPGIFGYGGYSWTDDRADVGQFDVPEQLEGVRFTLEFLGDDRFRLRCRDKGIAIDGWVGEHINALTGHGVIKLSVERIAAQPGTWFDLTRHPRVKAVEKLRKALTITEEGKQSGVLNVALQGTDRIRTALVLDKIGGEYIKQNLQRKSEEAEKSLSLANDQLPGIRRDLEQSEKEYNWMRHRMGTIDLAEEAKSIVQQSAQVQMSLVDLTRQKEQLAARFNGDHPQLLAIDRQIGALVRQQDTLSAQGKRLPGVERELQRITRDMKVNTDVYTALSSTAQQLRLVRASSVGNVRIVDEATIPVDPSKPVIPAVIAGSTAAGLCFGVMLAFVRKAAYGRINDPSELENLLALPVSVTVPHSPRQKRFFGRIKRKDRAVFVLPHDQPFDAVVESLRNFRTGLQYEMMEARNNIIMITGPTAGVGKSFISANFAAVLAAVGKSVLLIDADLRTGHLHRYFGVERAAGLSDVVSGMALPGHVIHRNVVENVDFLSTGTLPDHPAELLAQRRLGDLLATLSGRYDFILIDAAPVLPVSDALVIGAHAGIVFNVIRYDVTTVDEVEETMRRLDKVGCAVTRIVFNDSKGRATHGYRYGQGAAAAAAAEQA
jgi:tyrosine-protein kinase Etk/Wzc